MLFYFLLLGLLPKCLTGIHRLITDSGDIATIINNCYRSSFPKINICCPDTCLTAIILAWVASTIVTGAWERSEPNYAVFNNLQLLFKKNYLWQRRAVSRLTYLTQKLICLTTSSTSDSGFCRSGTSWEWSHWFTGSLQIVSLRVSTGTSLIGILETRDSALSLPN